MLMLVLCAAAGNVMHLVSSGVQHHLISQPAQVTVQSAAAGLSAHRLPPNASAQGSYPPPHSSSGFQIDVESMMNQY